MGSSSRRKSSKKKSSKLSSQARKMKKSKRNKSRKLGRRHDSSTDDFMSSHSIPSPSNSYSSNSDDDSISSKSFYTSSSKDTYRRKRSVSHSRSNVKRRKQARRRSPSRGDSRDLSHAKKRKRSKKNGDSKSRKNSRRKKHRRDIEISASRDSSSCSTCNGGSANERSEDEMVRTRSRENKKDMKDSRKGILGSTLSASGSSSHSSYSRHRDEGCSFSQSEETFMVENNSRRLRSVIIIAEKPDLCIKEGNELEKDMQKEELAYDHDDYPSKSSSGEGSKHMSIPCPPNAFDGAQGVENVGFISDLAVTKPSENGNDGPSQYHIHDPSSDEFEKNNLIKESMTSVPLPDSGSGGNDLEAILKQKALENLKKFRGALKTNVKPTDYQKDKGKGDLNGSSSSKAETLQSKLPPKQAGSTETQRGISVGQYIGKVSGTAQQNPGDQLDGLAHTGNSKEEGPTIRQAVSDEYLMGNSSFRQTSSGGDSALKQTVSSMISSDKGLIETEKSLWKTDPKIDQLMSPSMNTNNGAASTLVEAAAAENQNLNNRPDEAKDGSQYQQKTMSVMRGGEMVQVNYKVYIPKRAPALARRQLKR